MTVSNTFTLPIQPVTPAPLPSVHYANFGKRLAAVIIDWLIIGAIEGGLILIMGLFVAGSALVPFGDPAATTIGALIMLLPILLPLAWLYFSLQESSATGATIGKRAMGLRVTDMNGDRISFGRATGRYFGRLLSHAFCMFGYVMAAFTDKHQTLHDMVAGTLVMDVNESTNGVPINVAQRVTSW